MVGRKFWWAFGPISLFLMVAWLMTRQQVVAPVAGCPTTTAAADVIVEGQVFAVLPGGREGARVIVRPIRFVRGEAAAPNLEINAQDDATLGGSKENHQGLHFVSGVNYELFLRRESDGTYSVIPCSASKLLTTAAPT